MDLHYIQTMPLKEGLGKLENEFGITLSQVKALREEMKTAAMA